MSDTPDVQADTEDPVLARAHAAGAKVLTALQGISRVVMLYESNNTAVVRLMDTLAESLAEYHATGADRLQLQLRPDECFINGKLLRVDAPMWQRATDLAETLGRYGVGELTFTPDCGRPVIETFVADLGRTLRSQKPLLAEGGYEGLGLAASSGKSIASFRFEPDRLAIWLYAGLLEVVEQLYRGYAAGKTPSLLPIRRLLQLLVDSARSLGGIYQVLSQMRDPERGLTLPRLRVAITVDAVGFGIFMGLRNTELMTLALSSLLGALSDSKDPESAVEPLFSYPGLGSAAMSLILTVHDARMARAGSAAGVPGNMVATAEVFHLLTANPDQPTSAPDALLRMCDPETSPCDAAMAKLFAAYKGSLPLGSLLKLSDERLVMVMNQGDTPQRRRRPTVAVVEGSRLGEQIDLSEREDLAIVARPSAKAAGVDLTRLRSAKDGQQGQTSRVVRRR